MSNRSTKVNLKELWEVDLNWILTDANGETSKEASYKAEHIFELLSKNIFQTNERDDFKRLSVALSDYLKMVNFMEEIGTLQTIALAMSFGYYYRKLEEKHIVRIEENSNESTNKESATLSNSAENN